MIGPSGAEDYGRKSTPVRRIGKMLGFQAKTRVFSIDGTGLALYAVQEIPRIELNPRLGSTKPETPPAGSFPDFGARPERRFIRGAFFGIPVTVNGKTVVVTFADSRSIASADCRKVPAYWFGGGKVKGGTRHREETSRGNKAGIAFHKGRSVQF